MSGYKQSASSLELLADLFYPSPNQLFLPIIDLITQAIEIHKALLTV